MKFVIGLAIIVFCWLYIMRQRAQLRADRERILREHQQAQNTFQKEVDALNPHLHQSSRD